MADVLQGRNEREIGREGGGEKLEGKEGERKRREGRREIYY